MTSTYSTTATQLTVSGSASDNVRVTKVTWQTDHGASGIATGTTHWSALVPLQIGTTTKISVSAYDAAGNSAQDVLTVTTRPPPPSGGPITIEWQYNSTLGDVFQMERCANTLQTCPMETVAAIALSERQWTDSTVSPDASYCYRMAVTMQGMNGPYSNTMCSP